MTRPHRLILVASAVVVAAAIVVVVIVGAKDRAPRASSPAASGSASTPAASPATTGDIVVGLQAIGAGPTLSWTPVEGALEYQVAAVGPAGHWTWAGYGSSVVFGTLENSMDPVFWPDKPRIQVIEARPGETYRWFVIAFTDKGQIAATSELTSFTYQPPAGAPLPPRAPRHEFPALACSKLMPAAITKGALASFTMEESTPCGAQLGLGCPLSCGFHKRDDAGTTRVSFYFDCDHVAWDTYPKLDDAVALPGVGRTAQIAQHDEDTLVLVATSSTKCIVKVTSALDRATTVALARTLDTSLTPASAWMPDDWR